MKAMLILLMTISLILAGCAQEPSDPQAPAKAIERYLEMQISKDSEAFQATYCADFETEAKIEFDSFGAVESSLEDMSCTVASLSDGLANVTCTGNITMLYNGETNTFDLARFPYLASQENDEWKMCGYGS